MANPITWRNVQSRGSSGVAELLNGASASINRGISSFQGALTDQQDAQERNRLNQRENNLQNLNDAVARYDTPEALQAAQASGAFDALTSVPNMDSVMLQTIGSMNSGAWQQINTTMTKAFWTSKLVLLRRNT